MKQIILNDEQSNVLKGLLAQLMANQVQTNLQNIVTTNQNCLFFIEQIEKALPVEEVKKEEPKTDDPA